jgi:flagellar basal body-associated protein FliL
VEHTSVLSEEQRKANVRLALILASVAVVFAIGFVTKIWWFGS